MYRPLHGSMVYWRFKDQKIWNLGYCTYVSGYDLVRMGNYNGDTFGGHIVSVQDIEWKKYDRI